MRASPMLKRATHNVLLRAAAGATVEQRQAWPKKVEAFKQRGILRQRILGVLLVFAFVSAIAAVGILMGTLR